MQNANTEKLFAQLDKVGNFFQFRRKETIKSIKESIKFFLNDFDKLEQMFMLQEDELLDVKQQYKKAQFDLNNIQNKYDLVISFLNAQNINSESFERFQYLIKNDFLEFANNESSLAEEAKAVLILQDIENRLEKIVNFSMIYNKNIVAVGGSFSAGKSEFLNSFFLDNDIRLPVGIIPVTAIPTYITVSEKKLIKGYSYKGGIVELSANQYNLLSHDFIKSLGFNFKDIAPMIAITIPMKSYQNICFIDTPGYNPSNTGYTDTDRETSKEFLEHANTLLWVISIDTNGTIPASDLEYLENISLENKKIYIIANKADLRSDDDIENILDVFEEILEEYDIEYEGISAFSSINKEEVNFRKKSIFEFLEEINNPTKVKKDILAELNSVFKMYEDAINAQIKWIKSIHKHFKSLELDLLEESIEDNEKIDKRIETLKNLFDISKLKNQLNGLKKLENKMIASFEDIFNSIK